MKPITFKGQNVVFAKDQPEYLPLPAFRSGNVVTSCWGLSWRERLHALFSGKVSISLMTFGQPLQPILPHVGAPTLREGG